MVKSLLKALTPGANNNKEQQWEVVLMKNKYERVGGGGGGLECLQVNVGIVKSM